MPTYIYRNTFIKVLVGLFIISINFLFLTQITSALVSCPQYMSIYDIRPVQCGPPIVEAPIDIQPMATPTSSASLSNSTNAVSPTTSPAPVTTNPSNSNTNYSTLQVTTQTSQPSTVLLTPGSTVNNTSSSPSVNISISNTKTSTTTMHTSPKHVHHPHHGWFRRLLDKLHL